MGLFDRNWWVYAAAAGYLLAAGVCHYAGRRENPRFWNIIALAAVILAANKLFNLQHAITQGLRQYAREGGWYVGRRIYQKMVILGIAELSIVALAALAWWQRRRPWPARIALLLLAILVAFTAVRMVSLSPVDRYLGQELTGIRRHVWIELAAIATLTLAAARQATTPPPTP